MERRRKLNRLSEYDYSSDGLYFITSCVQAKICSFGEIADGEMLLNEYGKIAKEHWLWLEEKYPYVTLYSHTIMPNHMHGIIEINRHYSWEISERIAVGTGRDLSLVVQGEPIKIKSISELIGAYKTTTSKQIHLAGLPEFKWQRSFHDHIIRDAKAFQTITNYIENNPGNWPDDMFYKKIGTGGSPSLR
jgi:REP element-mobilizing transposase RayT